MAHSKATIAKILQNLDLGASVAEKDNLLESARVETSVFVDLLNDKVDLIPGAKGSGKSALYRIFVEFLPDELLDQRRVVVAHGVKHQGDKVFQTYNKYFGALSEQDFVTFWCVYLISLANEQFIKNPEYASVLDGCDSEIHEFKKACANARIPEFEKPKTFSEIVGWVLQAIKIWRPRLKYKLPNEGGELELNMFGEPLPEAKANRTPGDLPTYAIGIKETLESALKRADLSLWLMVDKLDELFPRRSELENRALRGLLKTLQIFESPQIRVKVFLRDDILEEVAYSPRGFTALTHITVRKADTLRWDEQTILAMIVKRLFAHSDLCAYLGVDTKRLGQDREYQKTLFYQVFPQTVSGGNRRYATMRWIYNRTMDGNGVVTPRDVINLLTKAIKHQYDECQADRVGQVESIIDAASMRYGLRELSEQKRDTYLKAEFPHQWKFIAKLIGGRTEITERAAQSLFGNTWERIAKDLIALGVLKVEKKADGSKTLKVPMCYRHGLKLIQGKTA